ncbi:LarC family nickel insertion protein [Paenibacillus sabuli]|nr:LarC family nickel insertion protein [Paenibacillus sabuli]
MALAALLDLGADRDAITAQLKELPIDAFEWRTRNVMKCGMRGLHLDVILPGDAPSARAPHSEHGHEHAAHLPHSHASHDDEAVHADADGGGDDGTHDHVHDHVHDHAHQHMHDHVHDHGQDHTHQHGHVHGQDHAHGHDHAHQHAHRSAKTILAMIEAGPLPPRVQERSRRIFQAIAAAEAKIHHMPVDEVHFHEVGAMDSIIDIIGFCLALESLQVDRILAGPLALGHGYVHMAHGLYPVPAPATSEIATGLLLSSFQANGELTTPTGAGIVKALAVQSEGLPPDVIRKIGYGAGTKDFEHPNIMRAFLLER